MAISVIVCTKNEEKYIEACLKALKRQIIKPEIIVVDGHSTDKTRKIARKYTNKIILDNKKGVGQARNMGAKIAKADIVAYCDADSRPPSDWTKKILKYMNNNIAISGSITSYDGSSLLNLKLKFWTYHIYDLASKIGYTCFCGSNMAFKKKYLLKYPFRVNLLEDYDISRRLSKVGKIGFYKNIIMPISGRRFEKGFHRIALREYVPNIIRLRRKGKTKDSKYFKHLK